MALSLPADGDRITVRDDELGVMNGDPDTSYVLVPLTRETYRTLFRKHTKNVANGRTHRMEPVMNNEALADDLIDVALESWSGVLCGGVVVDCTREYKLKLDPSRTAALLDRAGINQVASSEGRQESFRGA